MNNSYVSCSSNDGSFEYFSPSFTRCPVHSSYLFYSSPTQSGNTFPQYSYYQQQSPMIFPSVQQYNNNSNNADRTPLRQYHCFKKNELQILHHIYIQHAYPSIDILQQLANQLNVSIEKIRQWFKNRRYSDKQKKRTTA